jgi:hypothetical protein
MTILPPNQVTAPNCRQALQFRVIGFFGRCIRWQRPFPAAVGEFCRWANFMRFIKLSFLAVLLVVIGVTGCTSYPSKPSAWSDVHNEMTRQEVCDLAGPANWGQPEEHHEDGSTALAWEHRQVQISPTDYVGLEISYDRTGRVVSVGHTSWSGRTTK